MRRGNLAMVVAQGVTMLRERPGRVLIITPEDQDLTRLPLKLSLDDAGVVRLQALSRLELDKIVDDEEAMAQPATRSDLIVGRNILASLSGVAS